MNNLLYHIFAAIDYAPLPNVSADGNRLDTIFSVVFGIAGAVALLFLVIGGVRYIISRGDANATAQAKNTIIYAMIGLVIVIIAFSIVTFTLNVI